MEFGSQLSEQLRTLRRFPIPVALCVALALLLNLQIAGLIVLDPYEGEIIFAAAGASFASLAVALWFRARALTNIGSVVASAASAVFAVLLQLSHGDVFGQDVVVLGALILAVMVAAHLRQGAAIESFWKFDLQLGIAATMGIVALIIVGGGLSLLLESCRYLFDVKIAGSIDEHVWVTGAALIAPVFALAMIPSDMDEPFEVAGKSDLLTSAVSRVLNFALVPLVLIYSLMLHIYAAKIAITGNMPKGEVGTLVLTFGIVGTATYMVAYPWRGVGFRPVRWLMRSWFWLMVIPTALLTLAVWQRIAEYGVTPERYCLCLFAIWLAAMVVYLGVKRGRMDLRVIPASLALALLLSSFGPWGATAVSVRSQLAQLNHVLTEQDLLVNGRIRLDPPRIHRFALIVASNDRLHSILTSLDSLDALDRISPLFVGVKDDPFRGHVSHARLRKLLGIPRVTELLEEQAVSSQHAKGAESAKSAAINFDISGYQKLIGPILVSRNSRINAGNRDSPGGSRLDVGGLPVTISALVLTAGRGRSATSFNLAGATKAGKIMKQSPVLLPARQGQGRGMLIVVSPSAADAQTHENKFQVWLLMEGLSPALSHRAAKSH